MYRTRVPYHNRKRYLYHVRYSNNKHAVISTTFIYKFNEDYYDRNNGLTFRVVKFKDTDIDHMCMFTHKLFNGEQWFKMNPEQREIFNNEWYRTSDVTISNTTYKMVMPRDY